MKRAAVVFAVVAVVAIGIGIWWSSRSDPPPPLAVDDVAGASAAESVDADLDGTWEAVVGEDTVAGLRIEEERAAALGDNTAVGRTGAVRGSVEVADGAATAGSFSVDLSTLEFTDDPGLPVANRSEYLRTRALETDDFPEARFTLSQPVALPAEPSDTLRGIEVVGELDLHGVAQPLTVTVDVRVLGDRVVLGTSEPVEIELAAHGIEAPEIAGVSKVADVGSFEFVVVLERA